MHGVNLFVLSNVSQAGLKPAAVVVAALPCWLCSSHSCEVQLKADLWVNL
jgi:hypothetical protein